MKIYHWLVAVAGIAFGLPAPASAAVGSPEVIIYRFPGVFDDGGGEFAGVATLFICTNFSGVTETMRFVTRSSPGNLLNNSTLPINHLETKIAATHGPFSYGSHINLTGTSGVAGGTTAIAATSTNIICTAMVINAATSLPDGVALRGIRFSPVPGSQE